MSVKVELPTKIRVMNMAEYEVVSRVFGDTLPYKFRIWITNADGIDGRPFTIPTSLISTILGIPAAGFFGGLVGGYLASAVNMAYLINVGDDYNNLKTTQRALLVHETAHVWQGYNSTFSQTYVYQSIISQGLLGKSAYTAIPGQPWHSYNVEQQAQLVEDWFRLGEPWHGLHWEYIWKNVRKGDA